MIITQSDNPNWNNYKWRVFNGSITDSTHTTTDVTIEGDVATLVAEVQNGAGCTATDTFYITKFTTLGNNIINNDEYLHIYCSSDTGQFSVQGSTPTGGNSVYYYTWTCWNTAGSKFYSDTKDLQLNAWEHDTLFTFREVMSEGCFDRSDTIMLVPNMRENVINNRADTLIIYDHIASGMLDIAGNETEGTGSVSYQWYYSADSADWHEVTGQDQIDLEHDTFSGYRWFFRNAYIDDCYKRSNIVKVYPKIWNNVIGDTSVYHYCSDDSIQLNGTYPVGGNEPYIYQWLISDNGSVWNTIAVANGKDLNTAGSYPVITYFKRRAYSGSDSTESNVVQFIPLISGNTLVGTYNGYPIYPCPNGSNQVTYYAPATPVPITPLETPTYQWFYSYDSLIFEPISGQTNAHITLTIGDTILFIRREVYVTGCTSVSNVLKLLPVFAHNQIYADPCYDGTGNLNLSGNYAPAIVIPNQAWYLSFYTLWQNGHITFHSDTVSTEADSAKAKSATYTGNIDSFLSFRRLLVAYSLTASCYFRSPEIKVYNPSYLNQIEINQNDSIAGKILIPEGSYAVIWQKNYNNENWETITGINHNILNHKNKYACCYVRRLLIPLDNNKSPLTCDTFYSNTLLIGIGYITSQPLSKICKVGDSITFSISYNSANPVEIQWQKYQNNIHTSVWEDIEDETDSILSVYINKCYDTLSWFRVLLSTECGTIISDTISLTVVNRDFLLWLRDLPSDTAEQPNSILVNSGYHFLSPDIYASNKSTNNYSWGVSSTIYNGRLDLYTKVRNKGIDTSNGGKLYLYASLAGLNPEWDFHFTDKIKGVMIDSITALWNFIQNPNPPFQHVTFGVPINQIGIDIPPIPPNDSTVIHYKWDTPPDHFINYSISNVGNSLNPSSRSLIYLARIEECDEFHYGMKYPELFYEPPMVSGTIRTNTENNASIAALHSYNLPTLANFNVIPVNEKYPTLVTDIISTDIDNPIMIDIDFSNAMQYFILGDMYIYFDDILWNAFVDGGFIGNGYSIVDQGIFKITSPNNVNWNNINLNLDSIGHIGFSFHYKNPLPDTLGEGFNSTFRVTMSQGGSETGELFLHTKTRLPSFAMNTLIEDENEYKQDSKLSTDKQHTNTPLISTDLNTLVFSTHPNPFNNELSILVVNFEPEATITLRDINGKEISSFTLPKEPSLVAS